MLSNSTFDALLQGQSIQSVEVERPEWNLVLNVWFAPQFNTEHCTVPHDLLYCSIKSKQTPPNHGVLHHTCTH